MSRPIAALAAIVIAGVAASCSPPTYGDATTIHGAGAVTSESRATTPFRRIRIGEGVRLDARTGSAGSVSVSGQANILPLIDTTVTGDELVVSLASPSIDSAEPLIVSIVTPELDAVRLDPGASGTLDVTTPALELDVTGGATVAGSGTIGTLDLHADVGGTADLSTARVQAATVSIEAGGSATLSPDESVRGIVATGGNLVLSARPPVMRVDVRQGGTMIDG